MGIGPGPVVLDVVTNTVTLDPVEVVVAPVEVLYTVLLDVIVVRYVVYVGFGGQLYGHALPHVSVPL